jgi:L-asparaginase II
VQPGRGGPIENNCSGKHAAMLATCVEAGWTLDDYDRADHPLQLENLATLAAFAGLPEAEVVVAVDNCTVPTFALPLRAAARAFARLLDPAGLPGALAEAGQQAAAAMIAHPLQVGGTGRLDTALMEICGGRVVIKTGANGFHAAAGRVADGGVRGIAIKLAGAEAERAKAPIVVACLDAAGLLRPDEAAELRERFDLPQRNCRGAVVGGGRFVGRLG